MVVGNADFRTRNIAATLRIPAPPQSTSVIPAVVMDSSGLIHVGYGTRDQIQSFGSDGSLLGTHGLLDRPPSMPTEAEVQRHRDRMGELIRITGMELAEDEIERMVSAFEHTPAPRFIPTGLAVDTCNRLWVLANIPVNDRTHIVVFPRNESPFQLWVRDRALAITIRGSSVAVLVERVGDPSRHKGIDIYRIPDARSWGYGPS